MQKKNSTHRPPAPTEPTTLLKQTWALIQTGIDKRHSNYHTTYMSYIAENTPRSAALIPRHLDLQQFTLNCHTDFRSGKIKHLNNNNSVCLLFWCREHKTQLRVNGRAQIQHNNALTRSIWDSMQQMSKVCYAADIAPSTETGTASSGFTESQWDHRQTICNSDETYKNFAILEIHIEVIERLDLRVTGHQKIRFYKQANSSAGTTWTHQWLSP